MTIISHQTIADSHLQADGRRYIAHVFTDHLGKDIATTLFMADGAWTETEYLVDRAAKVTSIELREEESEESHALSLVEGGEDALSFTLSPNYSTPKKIAKKLIRFMMRERDPRIVIALEPLIVYLRANYNNTQLKNFLDLTTAQAQKMNQRINAVLDNKAAVFDVFDANEEDIE